MPIDTAPQDSIVPLLTTLTFLAVAGLAAAAAHGDGERTVARSADRSRESARYAAVATATADALGEDDVGAIAESRQITIVGNGDIAGVVALAAVAAHGE